MELSLFLWEVLKKIISQTVAPVAEEAKTEAKVEIAEKEDDKESDGAEIEGTFNLFGEESEEY